MKFGYMLLMFLAIVSLFAGPRMLAEATYKKGGGGGRGKKHG